MRAQHVTTVIGYSNNNNSRKFTDRHQPGWRWSPGGVRRNQSRVRAGLGLLGDTVWTGRAKLAPPGLFGADAQAITTTAGRSRRTAGPRLLLASRAPPPPAVAAAAAAATTARVQQRRPPCCYHRHAHCPEPQPHQDPPGHHGCRSSAGDVHPGANDTRCSAETPAPLRGRVVAFTTPAEYARRLEPVLAAAGATPLWCPTICVAFTPATERTVAASLRDEAARAAGIAFTSRAGIRAVARAVSLAGSSGLPPADPGAPEPGSSEPSTTFVMAALG